MAPAGAEQWGGGAWDGMDNGRGRSGVCSNSRCWCERRRRSNHLLYHHFQNLAPSIFPFATCSSSSLKKPVSAHFLLPTQTPALSPQHTLQHPPPIMSNSLEQLKATGTVRQAVFCCYPAMISGLPLVCTASLARVIRWRGLLVMVLRRPRRALRWGAWRCMMMNSWLTLTRLVVARRSSCPTLVNSRTSRALNNLPAS